MPSLRRLWRLHQIDAALHDIRKRAAALDAGAALKRELDALESDLRAKEAEARRLAAEQADLELAQRGIEEKLKKIDRDLYGGKVVNPREVENLEKEISMLKRKRGEQDDRLLQLLEEAPEAQKRVDEAGAKASAKRKELAEHQRKALAYKSQLEAEHKKLMAARPEATAGIEPGLLARYEAIRAKHGVAMAQVTKQGACGACGMKLPVKSIESAKEERLVTCEACHRILYYTEGLV